MARSKTTFDQIRNIAVWEPSDQTGATNMATELEDFIIASQGLTVKVLDSATILLENFGQGATFAPSGAVAYDVDIDFGRCSILQNAANRCIDLNNALNAGSAVSVTSLSDTAINSGSFVTQINLGATASGEAHDFFAITSDDANPSKSGGRLGEIFQLIQDETATTLYSTHRLLDSSAFTTSVEVRKLSKARKCRIVGGVWKSNGDADDPSVTTREECIRITGYVDPIVWYAEFESPWAQCVWTQCCAMADVWKIKLRDTLNMGDSNGLSYGCVFYGMNYSCLLDGAFVRNGRHPVGTTDGNSGSTTTWYAKGYPMYCTLQNAVGINCYGSVTDTHEEGGYTTVRNILAYSAKQDENEIFVGRAHQSRSRFENIENITAIGCAEGISFDDIDHGVEDIVMVSNVKCIDIRDNTGTAVAISIRDNPNANKRKIRFNGVQIENCDKGILCGDNAKVRAQNISMSSVDRCFEVYGGANVRITGGFDLDFEDTTAAGSSQIFNMRSDGTNGGGTVKVLTTLSVTKGDSSNIPSAIFEEADTTATKTYFIDRFVDDNPDGVNSLLVIESGATTLSEATDVTVYDREKPVTVANLPAASSAQDGRKAFVSDANATTFASIVAGGGANNVPVYSDGTNWRIG